MYIKTNLSKLIETEKDFLKSIKELEETLNGSKTNLVESKEMSENLKTVINSSKNFHK